MPFIEHANIVNNSKTTTEYLCDSVYFSTSGSEEVRRYVLRPQLFSSLSEGPISSLNNIENRRFIIQLMMRVHEETAPIFYWEKTYVQEKKIQLRNLYV